MPPRKRKLWLKLWLEWFTSLSHAGFDATTHGIGLRCFMQAGLQGWDENGTGWVTHGVTVTRDVTPESRDSHAGYPLSVTEIAALAVASEEQVTRALQKFLRAGTMIQRADGAYGFPGLRDWQDSPEAERQRKHRGNSSVGYDSGTTAESVTDTVTSGVTDTVTSSPESRPCHDQKTEVRSQKTYTGSQDHNLIEIAAARRTEPATVCVDPLFDASEARTVSVVARSLTAQRTPSADIDAVETHYRVHHPKAQSNDKNRGQIADRLREGFSVKDLCDAIDGCHRRPHNRGATNGIKYLKLSLITRDADHVLSYLETPTGPIRAAPKEGSTAHVQQQLLEDLAMTLKREEQQQRALSAGEEQSHAERE